MKFKVRIPQSNVKFGQTFSFISFSLSFSPSFPLFPYVYIRFVSLFICLLSATLSKLFCLGPLVTNFGKRTDFVIRFRVLQFFSLSHSASFRSFVSSVRAFICLYLEIQMSILCIRIYHSSVVWYGLVAVGHFGHRMHAA